MREQEHQFRKPIAAAVWPHMWHFSRLERGAVVSTTDQDTKLSFDMRVGMWLPVSVRLRKYKYFERYGGDFSIRSKTKCSGTIVNGELVMCEIDKLKAGLGNCYFYGWLTPRGDEIAEYMIVDMNRFRSHLDEGEDRPNRCWKTGVEDGTAGRYYKFWQVVGAGALVFNTWGDAEAA